MADYRLSKRADADIFQIGAYTAGRFGIRQADRYHKGLTRTFQMLAKHPSRGSDASQVAPNLRRWSYESHIVFYLPEPKGVLIVRVLHKRMEIGRHPMNDD